MGITSYVLFFLAGIGFGYAAPTRWKWLPILFPIGLALLTAVVVFAAVSLGLFIASFGGTERQVGAIGSVCLLVMGLLGGCMVPRALMPASMQKVGLFTPHAWALDGYYDVLVRAGTGLADLAVPIAAVLAFGLAFATVGSLRFDFER